MSKYVIVGAGSTGSGVATRLSNQGHDVIVVSRSGKGPSGAGIELVAADATDANRLSALCESASAVFNCANPQYHKWPTDWPPLASSILASAERSGATLVTLSNLYVYGVPTGPMGPHDPLAATYEKAQVRIKMWRDALAAHDAGRVKAVEVRASDFVGPGDQAMLGDRTVPRILAGKSVSVLGNPDMVHSWTYVGDVCDTLVNVAQRPDSWGRAWHVATNEPRTSRQAVSDLCAAAGVAPVKVKGISRSLLRLAGIFSPVIRELPTTLYQFEQPFIIDDRETREILGLLPTPWDDIMNAQISAYRSEHGAK